MFGAPIVRWDSRNPSAYGRVIVAGRQTGKSQRNHLLKLWFSMNPQESDYTRTQSLLDESEQQPFIQSQLGRFVSGHGRNNAAAELFPFMDARDDLPLISIMDLTSLRSITKGKTSQLSVPFATDAGMWPTTSFILNLDLLMVRNGYPSLQKVRKFSP